MKIFRNRKEKKPRKEKNSWQLKYEALEKDHKYLKQSRAQELHDAVTKCKEAFIDEENKLHKEVVFWKEKAMNFKRYHQ